jgi:hypothetical protein
MNRYYNKSFKVKLTSRDLYQLFESLQLDTKRYSTNYLSEQLELGTLNEQGELLLEFKNLAKAAKKFGISLVTLLSLLSFTNSAGPGKTSLPTISQTTMYNDFNNALRNYQNEMPNIDSQAFSKGYKKGTIKAGPLIRYGDMLARKKNPETGEWVYELKDELERLGVQVPKNFIPHPYVTGSGNARKFFDNQHIDLSRYFDDEGNLLGYGLKDAVLDDEDWENEEYYSIYGGEPKIAKDIKTDFGGLRLDNGRDSDKWYIPASIKVNPGSKEAAKVANLPGKSVISPEKAEEAIKPLRQSLEINGHPIDINVPKSSLLPDGNYETLLKYYSGGPKHIGIRKYERLPVSYKFNDGSNQKGSLEVPGDPVARDDEGNMIPWSWYNASSQSELSNLVRDGKWTKGEELFTHPDPENDPDDYFWYYKDLGGGNFDKHIPADYGDLMAKVNDSFYNMINKRDTINKDDPVESDQITHNPQISTPVNSSKKEED